MLLLLTVGPTEPGGCDSCLGGLTVTLVPRAKKYGPVVRVNVFHKTSVIVTSPESVKVGDASVAMSSL